MAVPFEKSFSALPQNRKKLTGHTHAAFLPSREITMEKPLPRASHHLHKGGTVAEYHNEPGVALKNRGAGKNVKRRQEAVSFLPTAVRKRRFFHRPDSAGNPFYFLSGSPLHFFSLPAIPTGGRGWVPPIILFYPFLPLPRARQVCCWSSICNATPIPL